MVGGWSNKTKLILNSTQFKLKLKVKGGLNLKPTELKLDRFGDWAELGNNVFA